MAEREENLEKEDQPQESAFEITELDDQDLEDVSGGVLHETSPNENCHSC